jgi:hypothetical protein
VLCVLRVVFVGQFMRTSQGEAALLLALLENDQHTSRVAQERLWRVRQGTALQLHVPVYGLGASSFLDISTEVSRCTSVEVNSTRLIATSARRDKILGG